MITAHEVKKIASLAKLNFSDEKISNFTQQLTTIMNMIDSLNEVDCENVEPLTSVCDMYQRMRTDEVTSQDNSNELMANVGGKESEFAKEIKCFIVPKVVE